MPRAILRLKNGERRTCTWDGQESVVADLLACGRTPARMAGRTLHLKNPEGPFDVSADDIAGVEFPPPYRLIENLLAPDDAARITAHALAHESLFEDATISLANGPDGFAADTRFRQSRVLNNVGGLVPLIMPRLEALIPTLLQEFGLGGLPLKKIECQLTANGDGDFFKTHTDNALPEIAHRHVSYVYYFHRDPKQFSGGHLKLYNTLIADGFNDCGDCAFDYAPLHNSLMVFPSYLHHEVTPVACATRVLADQRLTLNGWLCA